MAPDTHPSYVTAAGAAFLGICPIVVALRFYARSRQRVRFGVDDWLTLPALLMVIGCAVNVIIGVNLKVYAYPTRPGPDGLLDFAMAEKFLTAFTLMQILSIAFIKLSFVFLFRRIFVDGRFKGVLNVVSLFVASMIILWILSIFFWILFACGTRFSARWTSRVDAKKYCPTDNMGYLALGISDMITDVAVLTLPIPNVLRLHMKTSRKIAVLALFGLGTLSLVASIIRLVIFVNAFNLASKPVDVKLLITQASYWPMLESGLALIACCLPVLYALRRPMQNHWKYSSYGPARTVPQSAVQPQQAQNVSGDVSATDSTTWGQSLEAKTATERFFYL